MLLLYILAEPTVTLESDFLVFTGSQCKIVIVSVTVILYCIFYSKPRFLLLPEVIQERLLEFLHGQAFLIPDLDIKELIHGLIKYTDLHSNLYQQLLSLVRKTKVKQAVIYITDL